MASSSTGGDDPIAKVNHILYVAKEFYDRAKGYKDADLKKEEPSWATFAGLDPLCSERQRFMAFYDDQTGVKGLSYMLYQIAKEDARLQQEKWRQEQGAKTKRVTSGPRTASNTSDTDITMTDSSDPQSGDGVNDVNQTDDEDEIERENDSINFANFWPSQTTRRKSPAPFSSSPRAGSNPSEGEDDENTGGTGGNNPGSFSTDFTVTSHAMTSFEGVSPTWKLILDDYTENNSARSLFYLSSIPPEVTSALIRGDLPSKMQDPAFARTIGPLLRPRDCQGVYAVYISRSQLPEEENQAADEVGKGLTLREIRTLTESMEFYMDVGKQGSAAYAQKVDEAWSGGSTLRASLNYKKQRRYASGESKTQFLHHEEWLKYVRLYYTDWITQATGVDRDELDTPLARCFVYVGLGKNVLGRCTNHWSHSGHISPVFGLVCAILQYEFPDRFTVQGSTYQILRTVAKKDIGFDEKLITLLCSAYPWDGGLSTAYAGQSRGKPKAYDQQHRSSMKASFMSLKNSGIIAKNLEESDVKIAKIQKQMESALLVPEKIEAVMQQATAQQRAAKDLLRTLKPSSSD